VPRGIERGAGVTSQGRDQKLSFDNDSSAELHEAAIRSSKSALKRAARSCSRDYNVS